MDYKISKYKAWIYFHTGVISPNTNIIIVKKLVYGSRCYEHKTNYLPQTVSFQAVLWFILSIFTTSDLPINRMSRQKHGLLASASVQLLNNRLHETRIVCGK